jgi:calcium release-activated calcium channel protein 1
VATRASPPNNNTDARAHQHHRERQARWRAEDVEQRALDNARVLWARILERNRRDVEEKSEQLKAISTLAALIAGFALSAFLQVCLGVG